MNNMSQSRGNYEKKDIYVIKNKINDKVYVGQSINPEERFIAHCKPSSARDNSLIDKAIQKYGAENFWVEVLEKDVKKYNEREKYWIKKLNSLKPNGYNIQEGGEDPPVFYSIDHPTAFFHDLQIIKDLKNDLKNTKMSLSKIAEKYKCSKRTVLRINQGLYYEELDEKYPIREVPNINGKLTEEQVEEIIEILKNTYRQYEDISAQYGTNISAIKLINSGATHKKNNIDYPIRKYKNSGKPVFTYGQVTEIIDLLQNTTLSMRQIGFFYKVNVGSIIIINNGSAKRYRRENVNYPIRPINPRRSASHKKHKA